jgi:hypothetical protein
MLNSLFSFPTFLVFSPFRLVRSNSWVQWKHLTPERSIDLCLQTFPKLLLLLVPKVTTRSVYPECIANLKLPIDAFYRESRSGVKKRRNVGKLNNELNIVNQLVDLHFLLFINITGNWKNCLAHTRQIIISDWLSLSESS